MPFTVLTDRKRMNIFVILTCFFALCMGARFVIQAASGQQVATSEPSALIHEARTEIVELNQKLISAERTLQANQPLVGSIVAFAGIWKNSDDSSWVLCDGSELRKADYPELAKLFQENPFGKANDPENFFKLPDLRRQFLRGASDTIPVGTREAFATAAPKTKGFIANVAPVGAVGQTDTRTLLNGHASGRRNLPGLGGGDTINPFQATGTIGVSVAVPGQSASVSGGDDETRPMNISVNWLIRAR